MSAIEGIGETGIMAIIGIIETIGTTVAVGETGVEIAEAVVAVGIGVQAAVRIAGRVAAATGDREGQVEIGGREALVEVEVVAKRSIKRIQVKR